MENDIPARLSKMYTERVATIAEGLRRLADEFEREATPSGVKRADGLPAHATAAGDALHALFWGVANLHADSLVAYAAQADRVAVVGES